MEQLIALALGAAASYLQGEKLKDLPTWARYGFSLVACVVAGLAASLIPAMLNDGASKETILANIGAAFIASQTYYNGYFKLKK